MSKITIQDVAKRANVSVATIDRVLNRRPGVRSQTVERVESAIRELNYQPDRIAARLARGREYRLWFILPTTAGEFMQSIGREVEEAAVRMSPERVAIMVKKVDVFDGPLLAQTLDELGEDVDGVALVALDHPAVREAINALVAHRTPMSQL